MLRSENMLPRDNTGYVPSLEIIKAAETHLIRSEEIMEMVEEGGVQPDDYKDTCLECDDYHLSIEEVRKVYDSLTERYKLPVKRMACKLVSLVQQERKWADYNFDNALVTLAKIGVFLALPDKRQVSPTPLLANV